ncbi:MAG: hypothetical protein KJN85_09270 [Maribacter sp.]|nr:hypothetical protein [Maribacter sp.]MBT8314270.1 hypothetical protein [Maribacter sp.]
MTPSDYNQFIKNLNNQNPPREWPLTLKALWFDAKGNWEASHEIAQDIHTELGNWIHAYLHRKEGDEFNAGYWYRRANRPFPNYSLDDELEVIVNWILRSEN